MTLDFLAPFYLWTKSLHLIAVIAWMAGLFYLPRLFIYHFQVPVGDARSELFKVMERRLLKAIMNPAMIATWVFGLALILTPGAVDWTAGWWHLKLTSVLLMSGFHGMLGAARKRFEADGRPRTERAWRFWNEVPTLLLIVIVIMVIVKPF
ncbi:protoporphyrinogen oxidase HemJ [Roseomonas frigidaquae]|uniref:Protoporphyrinogen IX oxidase n=1 Tax=Falsiroseomonas frigidaquae TaxID=487318 RepID=A0ABX1EZY9_9PROT|nr:protoporphyrinogen oxidase HemJ [Falsiroseomonas frigidaquae]NKE45613.1 protoporphyrinogen oxidase HemJ [Falsiroseomonas frigidaquae]